MGEGTPGLERTTNKAPDDESTTPRAITETLGAEIAVVRDELDGLLAELDRRRHDALDVRLQLRRHSLGAALTMLALVTTTAGGVWLGVWRHRRRAGLTAQAGRLRHAISRITEHPERVPAEPTMAGKIVTAAASAAAAALVKKLLERAVQRLLEQQPADGLASPPRVDGRDQKAA
jgi:hypothetical protein